MMLTRGNKKLGRCIAIFSLPAGNGQFGTCKRKCPGCYALKIERLRPVVLTNRIRNLAISENPRFELCISRELHRLKNEKEPIKYVRVHEGGDFYNQEYVEKWWGIAMTHPDLTFYCYTKATDQVDFSGIKMQKNFIVFDSLKPLKRKPNFLPKREFEKIANTPSHPLWIQACRYDNTGECGVNCIYCMKKENEENCPIFLKH